MEQKRIQHETQSRAAGRAAAPKLHCPPLSRSARSAAKLSRPPSLQVLQKYFGAYRPGVMGMSMDESAHLLWRLMNGQIPRVNQVGGRAPAWCAEQVTRLQPW